MLGLILALAGAVLDFYSSYLFATLTNMTVENMGVKVTSHNSVAFGWSVGLFVLGCALVIAGIGSVSMIGRKRMSSFGLLMVGFGGIMLLIGGAMYSGLTPMMAGSSLSGLGMLIVGALMVLNGLFMARSRSTM